jgi:paraquat-inducible protein B
MSKQTNPTLIGAFVIGAAALIALAVVLFGGTELLKTKQRYVTYFDRSVKGLRVGSNVLFKGVRIGYVTDIKLIGDVDTLEFGIPVTFEVLPEAVTLVQGGHIIGTSKELEKIDLERMVEAGLRAQLNSESFVTGQLLIELDLVPDSPAVMSGQQNKYPEIPSIPSDIQQAIEDLQRFFQQVQSSVDVRQVMENLQNIAAGLDRIVNSEEVERAVEGLERFINADDTQSLSAELQAAIDDFRKTMTDFRATTADFGRFAVSADSELREIVGELEPVLRNLDEAVDDGANVLRNLNKQLGAESEINHELIITLNEVQRAARSLRTLLQYLEQNPEALLKGKKE